MPVNPLVIDLIRRFEPILYFHKDESFFPSDAKRYLEHCALWEARSPFPNKASWRVRIPAQGIAADRDEISQPGLADDTYLGLKDGAIFPFLLTNAGEERYLNPSGWINDFGVGEFDATPGNANRYAALRRLARLYGSPPSDVTIPALRNSRFWYHAETFDKLRLLTIAREQKFTPSNLVKLLEKFKNPFAICYYLFYPGHVEGLQGCEETEEATGPVFASFAGEWVCVTVLLDRPDPTPEDPNPDFEARFLGLGSRNANKNGQADVVGRVFDAESRVGMVIHDFAEVSVFGGSPEHARLFVARGTHCPYVRPGPKTLQPRVPGDPTRGSCGLSEAVYAGFVDVDEHPDPKLHVDQSLIDLAKIVGCMATLGVVGAGVLGVVAGVLWSILEDEPVIEGVGAHFAAAPPTPGETQMDAPPDDGQFGVVLHPGDFVPPDASAGTPIRWPDMTSDDGESIEIDSRKYSLFVDRTNPDESLRQVWFPSTTSHQGYDGRWGPRVTPDPAGQRTGMTFPPFVEMFLSALARQLSIPPGP